MIIDNYPERNTNFRRVMNYSNLDGFNDIIRIAEVNNRINCQPVSKHKHKDSFELHMYKIGKQNFVVGNSTFECDSNRMVIIKPNEVHSTGEHLEEISLFYFFIFHLTPDMEHFFVFNKEETKQIKDILFNQDQRVFDITGNELNLAKRIIDIYYSDTPFKGKLIMGLTLQLMVGIFHDMLKIPEQNDVKPRQSELFLNMKNYICDNIFSKTSVSDLAHYTNLSESRIYQIFSENGTTVHRVELFEKISYAKYLLQTTNNTVTDIAYKLNFSSSQHFAKVFYRYEMLTPTEYRKANHTNRIQNQDG